MLNKKLIKSSFRDPSGQCYTIDNDIYRQITSKGIDDYHQLMRSGLYEKLQSLGYLISSTLVSNDYSLNDSAVIVLKADKIRCISYPYEWCFSQLQDAALLTLQIATIALDYGMVLKDASAYNIQFHHGKPILIDTCSFTTYKDGEPWVAYKQFCQHFLAPLALMAKKDIRLSGLVKNYIDGIPLDLASRLLPLHSKFSLALFVHIHLNAKFQYKSDNLTSSSSIKRKMSKIGLLGFLDNLSMIIKKLSWKPIKTLWADYYSHTNYSDTSTKNKILLLQQLVSQIPQPSMVWDIGGNNGFYSRAIMPEVTSIICWDIDPVAVEFNYRTIKAEKCSSILPLIQDLTNPSPSIGWDQTERLGFKERGHADVIMALALVHHLAISNNVPLTQIAEYFSGLGEYLIIEFVPKEDSMCQQLLANRDDIFDQYDLDNFKKIFSMFYSIQEERLITDTVRTMFLMKRNTV